MDNNQPDNKELELAGKTHLDWLEAQTLTLLDVPLFKIFSYELVQLLNHQYLKTRLSSDIAESESA